MPHWAAYQECLASSALYSENLTRCTKVLSTNLLLNRSANRSDGPVIASLLTRNSLVGRIYAFRFKLAHRPID